MKAADSLPGTQKEWNSAMELLDEIKFEIRNNDEFKRVYGILLPLPDEQGKDRYKKKDSAHLIELTYGDGTVTDLATGLMWMQTDSAVGLNWEEALAYAEDLNHGAHDDWRLPHAKELQSIVDYTRSPDTTESAAIDPIFQIDTLFNEAGQLDYPFYWTSTTHVSTAPGNAYASAAYIAFGRAMGYMRNQWMDVHGAGAQRSDPKQGNPTDFRWGRGPQGDNIRIYNHVRCVRTVDIVSVNEANSGD